MKRFVVTSLTLLTLIAGGSILASCAQGEVTRTITIKETVTNTQGSFTTPEAREVKLTVTLKNTITTTIQGTVITVTATPIVLTPVFNREAPEIPHTFIIDIPNSQESGEYNEEGEAICWECHPVAPVHSLWIEDIAICDDCHDESDNLILLP